MNAFIQSLFSGHLAKVVPLLLDGLKYTLMAFCLTALFAVPLGLLLTFAYTSKSKILKKLVGGYVFLMRGTPLLLQLFFFYFALPFIPYIGPYVTMARMPAAIVAFSLNYAAYFAEIFRGGILSVENGQWEAAAAIGLSPWQIKLHIVIPQMFRISMPALINELITLVKDSALISTIAIDEILSKTKRYVSTTGNIMPYLYAAVLYMIIIFILTKILQRIEKKLSFEK